MMKCEELKLFLYAEGLASEAEAVEMKDHLTHCTRCQKQLEQLKFATDCFTTYYKMGPRVGCPTSDEMVLLQEGELDHKREAEIESHVAQCPFCQEELVILKTCDSQEEDAESKSVSELRPLSKDVLNGISNLRQKDIRRRMEHVISTLVGKGKEMLTPEKIGDLIERYLFQDHEPVPVYALPEAMAGFDTALALDESAICDITVTIGKCTITLRLIDDVLTIKATRHGVGVGNVEVTVTTKHLGVRRATTDIDGIGVIIGIRQGPYQISIHMPND